MTRWNRSTRLALLVIGSLATSVAAQPAAAPNKSPAQQQIDLSRLHFEAAKVAMKRGDYQAAVTEYLAAYQLYPDPEFLFNVGKVYQLAGNEPEALTYYQKYLDLDPDGRGAADARTAIDELRRSIAAKQDAARRAEVPPPAPATYAWYRDSIALTLLGTGVAATGVGTGFLVSAQLADHDARTAPTYPQAQDAANRARQRRTVGSITGGVGVALVGGGLAWIFLHRGSSEPRTVTGWLAPGGGGLAITGPF
jgi:tetratricopeptide (TPR) repeat protein